MYAIPLLFPFFDNRLRGYPCPRGLLFFDVSSFVVVKLCLFRMPIALTSIQFIFGAPGAERGASRVFSRKFSNNKYMRTTPSALHQWPALGAPLVVGCSAVAHETVNSVDEDV
jgi:hypothetical protein